MARDWDHYERLYDERFFLDEETLACAQAYLIRQADNPGEGDEIHWWYEVGFKLNEANGNGHFCCYEYDDDKEEALGKVRRVAAQIHGALGRLIEAIDAQVAAKNEGGV